MFSRTYTHTLPTSLVLSFSLSPIFCLRCYVWGSVWATFEGLPVNSVLVFQAWSSEWDFVGNFSCIWATVEWLGFLKRNRTTFLDIDVGQKKRNHHLLCENCENQIVMDFLRHGHSSVLKVSQQANPWKYLTIELSKKLISNRNQLIATSLWWRHDNKSDLLKKFAKLQQWLNLLISWKFWICVSRKCIRLNPSSHQRWQQFYFSQVRLTSVL